MGNELHSAANQLYSAEMRYHRAVKEALHKDGASDPSCIDPETAEGRAILRLFKELKLLETPDGSWPGADVVDVLNTWLCSAGIHPAEESADAIRRLRFAPSVLNL